MRSITPKYCCESFSGYLSPRQVYFTSCYFSPQYIRIIGEWRGYFNNIAIALLGLMAVIINPILIILATYIVLVGADRVTAYLQPDQQAELLAKDRRSQIWLINSAKVARRR